MLSLQSTAAFLKIILYDIYDKKKIVAIYLRIIINCLK